MEMQANILLCIIYVFTYVITCVALEIGSCSKRCNEYSLIKPVASVSYSCSCSPSCVKFGDCCWNSPFKPDKPTMKIPSNCIEVEGYGTFSAISSCPSSWKLTSDFCLHGTGHLPPVSSLSTGATYANIHCAICNSDARNVTDWDVSIHCCPGNPLLLQNFRNTRSGFHFEQNTIWRWSQAGKFRNKCPCTFRPRNNDKLFVPQMTEMRKCISKEISTCSYVWPNDKTRHHCESYLDPVYVYDRVYKNLHCAMCNFDNISEATCVPAVMKTLYRRHFSAKDIQTYCEIHNLKSCLHYLQTSKGNGYEFSNIFVPINSQTCIPPPGERCCSNKKYSYRRRRCVFKKN